MTSRYLEISATVPIEAAGQRLDQALAALLPDYSRSRLKGWIESGEILVDGAPLPVGASCLFGRSGSGM